MRLLPLVVIAGLVAIPAVRASAATAPRNTVVPKVSGTVSVGNVLTTTPGTWTGSPAPTFTYQWQRCVVGSSSCSDIAGATKATYTLVTADKGRQLQAKVVGKNSAGSRVVYSPRTTTVAQVTSPANTVPPTITGSLVDGATVTATSGTWSGSPVPTFVYQWQRCTAGVCSATGAAGPSYVLTSSDVGKTLAVTVTATNIFGSATKQSAQTAMVTGLAPSNTAPPTIAGSVVDGGTVTATSGTWAGSPVLTYAYRWQRCTSGVCAAISASGPAYVLTPADIGKTMAVVVTATNAYASVSKLSAQTPVVAGIAPANTVLPMVTGSLVDGGMLSTTDGTWTGSPVLIYTYQWQRCTSGVCTAANASGPTYLLSPADVGTNMAVLVTATNIVGSVSTVSAQTALVTGVAPVNTAAPSIVGTPLVGTELSIEPGTWTGSAPLTFTFQWQRCASDVCAEIGAAPTYVLTPADVGMTMRVLVTAANSAGSAATASEQSAAVAGNTPNSTELPTILGTPISGTELSSSPGTWTDTSITFGYQWMLCDSGGVNCANLVGATSSTYIPHPTDIGGTLVLAVTGSDGVTTPATANSAASAVVISGPNPPVSVVPPTVDGTPLLDGDTLQATPGEWADAAFVAQQWQRCDAASLNCQELVGVTGPTFLLQPADVDHTIVMAETATNMDGSTVVVSAASALVAAAPPVNDPAGLPSTGGAAVSGSLLSAVPGVWTGTPTVTFAYQWESSADGTTWVPLDNANSKTYQLTAAEIGKRVRVVVTASNASATTAAAVSGIRGPVAATGVLWGISDSWQDSGALFDATERRLGRPLALVREYQRLDDPFVSARDQQLVDTGHSLVLSVRSSTKSASIPYTDITSGKYDAAFVTGLGQLNQLATPAYFIFHHEPDTDTGKRACSVTTDAACGAQFVAAWKHVYTLAKTNGYTNVTFVWTVTTYGFSPQSNVRNNYYWPGSAFTDWVGVDGYNGGCQGNWYGSFTETFAKSIAWMQSNAPDKPIMLPEWGAVEGATPTAKADFFNGVSAALAQPGYDRIRAMSYWNEASGSCNFRVDSSPASLDAYRLLGYSPLIAP
jgi:hypothetical protein